MNTEKWKPIIGYEGLYEISNRGRVKSLVGFNGHVYVQREKILKMSDTTTGYKKIELTKNKTKKSYKVHRLVANAFLTADENRKIVNHKDGNPTNNNVDNLEWCTQRENVLHALKTGLRQTKQWNADELKKDYCEKRMTLDDLAQKNGVTRTTIARKIKELGLSRPKSRYGIDIEILKRQFDEGMSNKELSKLYGCKNELIARRRYQYKNNMI